MSSSSRDFELHEANYRQLLDLKPNLAVLQWGATSARGAAILEEATANLARVLIELSGAKNGDFPFIIPNPSQYAADEL